MTTEQTSINTIDPGPIRDRIEDPSLTVVDVRSLAAYNGWRLGGEVRGGHVPGAVAFPIDLAADSVDDPEIARLLATKRITPDRDIVVYGDTETMRGRSSSGSRRWASRTPGSYEGGFPAGPPIRRSRSSGCPSTTGSSTSTGSARSLPASARRPPPRATSAVPRQLRRPRGIRGGHIPGALYLDTNWLEDPADWNRRSPDVLDAALRGLGITNDTTVIVYGRDTEGEANEKWPGRRAGQIAATRALMILRYAGVDDVRLLDGGYDWWVRAGNPVEPILARARRRWPRSGSRSRSAPR